MKNDSYILKKGELIDGKYQIIFSLKKGTYAETYRVKDNNGKIKLLKLFIYSQLNRTQFTSVVTPLEIEVLKSISHPNVVKYYDSAELIVENQKYGYVILDFISGETLAEKMMREDTLNQYEAKSIILGVLNGLNYLHSLDTPLIHNDITNLNVMLDLSGKEPVPKLIDFGYARWINQAASDFLKEGLNPFYQSNEAFNKVFSVQSDVFSVGALYYHLLFGMPPWFVELSKYNSNRVKIEDAIVEERQKKLSFPDVGYIIDEATLKVISKALQPQAENRFKSVNDFIKAVNGELEFQLSETTQAEVTIKPKKVKKGNGFSSIAGMQDLKELIKNDVIDLIENPEEYKRHGLNLPNGILLYGPPGCGKTFFAEKFAEEVGFNFYQIKPSDIQSKWVNASQENVKKLFDEAIEQSPSIIFIDEIDALVPNRENSGVNHMNTSVVNEFLAQMNNAGERGLFIIGATNLPTSIDPAILRSGRLEQKYYIAPPDFEARKVMFEIYLKNRPIDFGIDYDELAKVTEGYVSADIKYIVDKTSRMVIKEKLGIITINTLKRVIADSKPTISKEVLQKHEAIRDKFEGVENKKEERPKIGFK